MKQDVFDPNYAIAWTIYKIRSLFYDQRKREDETVEYHLDDYYDENEPGMGLQIDALHFLKDQEAISGYKDKTVLGNTVLTLSIHKPKFDEIEEKYKYHPPTIQDHIKEVQKEFNVVPHKDEPQEDPEQPTNTRPYCIVENGFGYLKFGKFGAKIKIGKADGQPFRLMQCLTEPFGIAKVIDTVYEAIRESKDKRRSDPYTGRFDKLQKLRVIQNTIKEVQKGQKLKGKLKFRFDDVKSKIWLEYIG